MEEIKFPDSITGETLTYRQALFIPAIQKKMLRAIKTKGHNSFFIYGEKGAGKSTYALLCLRAVYGSWEEALKYICNSRSRIQKILRKRVYTDKKGNKRIKRIPLLVWDDATFENMKTKKYDSYVDIFTKFYTVVRSGIANFMWTAPSFTLLPGKLRDLDWTLIRITRPEREYAKATFYKYNESPTGGKYMPAIRYGDQKIQENFYFRWIPQKYRNIYEVDRDRYYLKGLDMLDRELKYGEEKVKYSERFAKEVNKKWKKSLKAKKESSKE